MSNPILSASQIRTEIDLAPGAATTYGRLPLGRWNAT